MLSSLFPHRNFIRLDGGMGSMLQKGGMPVGALPEVYNITEPERIIGVQKQFVAVGSDVIYANTFGANRHKMAKSGYSVQELIAAGIACARKACEGTQTKVALDIGPIGQLLEPLGTLTFEEAYDIFREEILAGQDADLIVIETMTDLYETKAALLAAKENSDKPVICTMTFEPNLRTFTGCTVASAAMTLEGLGADAVGVNCSLGPDELYPIVEEMAKTYAGKVDFYKVDIDKEQELAQTFGIQSIPTFLFIPVKGKPSAQMGAMQKADFEEMVKTVLK